MIAGYVISLIFVQLPFDHDDRRCFMFRLTTVRDWLMLAVPRRQNESPWYRHDDYYVVKAHVRHIDQVHRKDLIPDLIKKAKRKAIRFPSSQRRLMN